MRLWRDKMAGRQVRKRGDFGKQCGCCRDAATPAWCRAVWALAENPFASGNLRFTLPVFCGILILDRMTEWSEPNFVNSVNSVKNLWKFAPISACSVCSRSNMQNEKKSREQGPEIGGQRSEARGRRSWQRTGGNSLTWRLKSGNRKTWGRRSGTSQNTNSTREQPKAHNMNKFRALIPARGQTGAPVGCRFGTSIRRPRSAFFVHPGNLIFIRGKIWLTPVSKISMTPGQPIIFVSR